jgi:4-hydroxy-3-polyprenylbenzoate decarboxylase
VTPARIVVGVTGASGAPYAKRLISLLAAAPKIELGCVLSKNARQVWALECGGSPEELGVPVYAADDYRAPFASGSAGWQAMVVIPCSMGALGRIAHGTSDSLLTRAADVMLKERRLLVLVPRETPLSVIHLENQLAVARAGALVLPASPSFYGRPRTLEEVLDTVVGRVLDHLGVAHTLGHRWGSKTESA